VAEDVHDLEVDREVPRLVGVDALENLLRHRIFDLIGDEFDECAVERPSSMGMTVPRIDSDMPSENLSSQVITSCTLTLGGGTSSFSSMPQRRIRASSALACFCSSAWKCS